MDTRTTEHTAEILQFPTAARRTAVAQSRTQSAAQVPDFVEFAAGGASYHEAAIQADARERSGKAH
ncbi:DUF2735 domain-containing protein [Jiella marina]|uniref:DUF2735 domain-containing protein n=1 Tax=Jiella sp. LLJ827 TaxID=2917712 RepID=UPI002101C5E3|nr:DUF2735 domain-containing protein [Jiella sp. LLJ827]MCQ0987980.1 DUF2735 domain-containing protein [Jiella sp. LLJ827]